MKTSVQIPKTNLNGRTPLRPHQVKAVKAVINEFLSQTRTKYIAACGSGKTMVGLYVAEALMPRSVIVFLPSLALIRQTLIEWSREKMFKGNYVNLFVCSDQTITDDLDPVIITEEEFGHPITTDSLSVRRFLKAPSSGVKLIFSTYNSARVLAEGTPSGFQFDFAVMDEAHRTAGPAGKPFGIVLDDTKLSIKKRLFMTATPRLYKVKKAVLDSEVLSYSMDSPKLYGTTADRLPFKDAVDTNLITPYEILASVITSADVDRELLEKEFVFNNKSFDAKRIANLVSIRDAVKTNDIKKIFTFHGRIEDAKEFVEAQNPPIQDYLPDFKIFHINGAMPMEKRNQIMEEFRLAERAIISNAKVLSEGIDVPSVDMVTFMCPKKSTVDIVQAVGRVSRNHTGKKAGYVLLPLFLDKQRKETEDEAFHRTEFAFMWNVFKAMKSEDDTLDLIIKNESMKMGEAGEGYIPDFKNKIRILGSTDTFEAISRGIKTMIIETVGEGFLYWLGLFKALIREKGEYDTTTVFRGKQIGTWISRMRQHFNLGILPAPQIASLKEVHFVFDPSEYRFEEIYDLLASYKAEKGHVLINSKDWYKGEPIGTLIRYLRTSKKKGRQGILSKERIARLDALGMVWDGKQHHFMTRVRDLLNYKKQHKHLRVSQTNKIEKSLGRFVVLKRMEKRRGILPPYQEKILDSIGLDWEPIAQDFIDGYKLLKKFHKKHGHSRVPYTRKNGPKELRKLSYWVQKVRRRNKLNKLTPEETALISELKFDFNPIQADFDYKLQFLIEYRKEFGHCLPEWRETYQRLKIGVWVSTLRLARAKNRVGPGKPLTEENIKRLDVLGMVWDLKEAIFQRHLKEITCYQKKYGDCLVSRQNPKYRTLADWVQNIRVRYKKFVNGKKVNFRKEWIAPLNALGFLWSPKRSLLQLYIELLVNYRKKFGTFNVPFEFKDPDTGRPLGQWLSRQMSRLRKRNLPREYKMELKRIGLIK